MNKNIILQYNNGDFICSWWDNIIIDLDMSFPATFYVVALWRVKKK